MDQKKLMAQVISANGLINQEYIRHTAKFLQATRRPLLCPSSNLEKRATEDDRRNTKAKASSGNGGATMESLKSSQRVSFSPSDGDSSSSLSEGLSSSSSCSCEDSNNSTRLGGEWSPGSISNVHCTSVQETPSRPRVRTSLRSHFEATSRENWETSGSDGKPRQVEVIPKQHGFITSSLLDDNQSHLHYACNALSSCRNSICDEEDDLQKHEIISREFSDEEQSDVRVFPAFYSASARSLETCSETSYYSSCEAYSLASAEVDTSTSVQKLQTRVSASRAADLERMPTQVQAETTVNRRTLKPYKCSPTAASIHEGFSFQPAPLLKPPRTCTPVFSKTGTPCFDTNYLLAEIVSQSRALPSKVGADRKQLSSVLFARHFPTVHPHDIRKEKIFSNCPHANICNMVEPPSLKLDNSEKGYQFTRAFVPSLRQLRTDEGAFEGKGSKTVDGLGNAPTEVKPPNLSGGGAVELRSRSLGTRVSLKSMVKNLETALGGARPVSHPKTRTCVNHRDAKGESLKFLDRVFASPMKHRLKRADGSTTKSRDSFAGHSQSFNMSRSEMPDVRLVKSIRNSGSESVVSCKGETPSPRVTSKLIQPDLFANKWNTPAAMVQGYLQRVCINGGQSYTLAMDGTDDIYSARPCAMENHSSQECCKWEYMFECGSSKTRKGPSYWKSWMRKDHRSSPDLVGKMHVSTVLSSEVLPSGDTVHTMVSEFVLYDAKLEDDADGSQSLRFMLPDATGDNATVSISSTAGSPLSASMGASATFLSPTSSVTSLERKLSASPLSMGAVSTSTQLSLVNGSTGDGPSSSESSCPCLEVEFIRPYCQFPRKELAAIVIKSNPSKEYIQLPTKVNEHCPSGSDCILPEKRKAGEVADHATISECMTVLLPLGDHGLPSDKQSGPSPLIQQWRSGGTCECGGWDMNCGLRVFSTDTKAPLVRTCSPLSLSQDRPVSIFSQGSKAELMLRLSVLQDGLFLLCFHPEFPRLGAFAAAVAILHGKHRSSSTMDSAKGP